MVDMDRVRLLDPVALKSYIGDVGPACRRPTSPDGILRGFPMEPRRETHRRPRTAELGPNGSLRGVMVRSWEQTAAVGSPTARRAVQTVC